MGQFDGCFTRAFAELDSVVAKIHALEDWQLVSRVASVVWTFIEEGREGGCDGASAARHYVAEALKKAGVDLFKPYRAYLHGTREEVVEILRDIFPHLIELRRPVSVEEAKRGTYGEPNVRQAAVKRPAAADAESCFVRAIMELREVMAKAHLLDDWQLVSRIAHVVYTFIEEGKERGCDGASAAFTYITEALERAGIDRFKTYRAYLHGTRDDVLQVLRQIFPNLVRIRRPVAAEAVSRKEPRRAPPMTKTVRHASALAAAFIVLAFLALVIIFTGGLPLRLLTSGVGASAPEATVAATTPTQTGGHSAATATQQASGAGLFDDVYGFIRGAVEALNRERASVGIPPAAPLYTLKVPGFRAGYMAEKNYLSHYDREGRHPVYYYTRLDGGLYAVEENIYACYGCRSLNAEEGERMIRSMIYDDADSQWGHRDSLLDPCNNYVAVAVARNGSNVYAVVYMISWWASWIEGPVYADGVFRVKGYVKLPPPDALSDGRQLYPVFIYCDKPNPANYNKRSYSVGKICAGVLPPNAGAYYPDVQTIYADTYTVVKTSNGWLVDLKFKYRPPPGYIATVVIFAAPTGVKWSPMAPGGENRLKHCEVLNYAIEG
ncbi:CAP domain-containing protein [Pyrobaculum sp. 3827-6]|uniref:CAP domain-containing protein n=1 Tax=Pyrobaculum sp. 3827-6 TaxID=2983604 RepID=UPI0021DA7700|nr:CAP domain-containing protein [Pyrobaculum sp. 3827-6]MCU7788338.1 CAP domain-containing protein [Pyrobaculum sp. 3827-6]